MYKVASNKGADQPAHSADLHLCCSHMPKTGFLIFDLNIFYCFNIYMYKQKGRATSSSNISYALPK